MTTGKFHGGRTGPEAKYTTFISSDGHEFIIKKKVAAFSDTIDTMLTGGGQFLERERNEIKFPEIRGDVLKKVCHYLTYKKKHSGVEDAIPNFEVDPQIAQRLLIAAHYLDL